MNTKSFRSLLALALLLAGSSAARAQHSELAPIRTVSQTLDFWITNTENLVVPAADAMPCLLYTSTDWRPIVLTCARTCCSRWFFAARERS